MATQVTNYQCPACTGPLHYVGESGMLECDYCGSKYTAAEIEALYAEKEKAAVEAKPSDSGWGDEVENMRAYSCPSCGAELICDATTAATSCPYCGNPTVVPTQFSGTLKPDYIIPFKLGKDAAIDALKRHYKKKPLLPRAFSEQNHLEEVQGVYVPFWLYDGEGDVDAEFEATSSSSYQEGKFLVTETRHFHVERSGSVSFERVPVDARRRCQTNTWTPSSRTTTASCAPSRPPTSPAIWPTGTMSAPRRAQAARTRDAARAAYRRSQAPYSATTAAFPPLPMSGCTAAASNTR